MPIQSSLPARTKQKKSAGWVRFFISAIHLTTTPQDASIFAGSRPSPPPRSMDGFVFSSPLFHPDGFVFSTDQCELSLESLSGSLLTARRGS